ncbi:hypothetical protein BJY01DRAFT_154776 [Aspergillus pseudoustus]|uniref:Alcohol acetyltransferase n=1 Tax=Aspergillus pseudoustus TaxID=1810923 RepID=A0ABR4IF74_9EURO
MSESRTFLRYASPNEHRTISREDVGFYNAVVVGAIYELASQDVDVTSSQPFIAPLKACVLRYPFLGVVVRDKHTDKPAYEGVSNLNLEEHISILTSESVEDETKAIEEALPPILDRPWPTDIPPWRIVVLPLAPAKQSSGEVAATAVASRCFIAFSFSHTIGDGVVGLTFHRTFQAAWSQSLRSLPAKDISFSLSLPESRSLPKPFDTPDRLPISWKYLLAPLAGAVLPGFLTNIFGLRASASPIDQGTWTGAPIFHRHPTSAAECSRVRLIEIEAPLVATALAESRAHGTKLTATLHQLIVRALGNALPNEAITNFVSGTAVDMRASIGAPAGEWGLYVTGHYQVHPRPALEDDEQARAKGNRRSALSEETWSSAQDLTRNLAACGMRLQDQAIGLLRYAPSIRGWTLGKIGGRRDTSYEVSNLLAFDGGAIMDQDGGEARRCRVGKMVFVQPGNPLSAPLVFNVVSVKGGSLVIAVSWQAGALGLDKMEEEAPFVEGICEGIRAGFESLRGD